MINYLKRYTVIVFFSNLHFLVAKFTWGLSGFIEMASGKPLNLHPAIISKGIVVFLCNDQMIQNGNFKQITAVSKFPGDLVNDYFFRMSHLIVLSSAVEFNLCGSTGISVL